MLKELLYIYYYHRFMKENSKSNDKIDWNKWNRLDKMCEKYSK
jgi:hypothetical protein